MCIRDRSKDGKKGKDKDEERGDKKEDDSQVLLSLQTSILGFTTLLATEGSNLYKDFYLNFHERDYDQCNPITMHKANREKIEVLKTTEQHADQSLEKLFGKVFQGGQSAGFSFDNFLKINQSQQEQSDQLSQALNLYASNQVGLEETQSVHVREIPEAAKLLFSQQGLFDRLLKAKEAAAKENEKEDIQEKSDDEDSRNDGN
eukprot:TRINITY_DN9685_c0_g1_i1.p2 TRINITY_DN9685_c0_g1~~TRINITY_DN9685_c0_g1_i1.p2  ORF type:complete len:203 (+),score=39.12 TRINITY_DN9685_c0_g1_i1:64-672(+)